jgi:hypothetical protein
LIDRPPHQRACGPVHRWQRVGGLSVTTTEQPRSGARRVLGHFYEAAWSSYPVDRRRARSRSTDLQ